MENYFLSTFSLSSEVHLICSLNYRVLPCLLDSCPSDLLFFVLSCLYSLLYSSRVLPVPFEQGPGNQCCAGIFQGTELITQLESCLKYSCCDWSFFSSQSGPLCPTDVCFPKVPSYLPLFCYLLGVGRETFSQRRGPEYKVHFFLRIFK